MKWLMTALMFLAVIASNLGPTLSYAATASQGIDAVGVLAYDKVGCWGPCITQAIPAHSSQHWIRYEIYGAVTGCSWRIRDVGNQVVVRSGRVGTFGTNTGTVYGLYGWYRLELYDCGYGGNGLIANYT